MSAEELSLLCPQLFHVTRASAAAGIRRHGLISANCLLKLFQVPAAQREWMASHRRSTSTQLLHHQHGEAILPPHRPPGDPALGERADALADWARAVNSRVFFWTDEDSARRDAASRLGDGVDQVVLVFDTLSLVKWNLQRIELSWADTRRAGSSTPIADGDPPVPADSAVPRTRPLRRTGRARVIELAMVGGVRDVALHLAGSYLVKASAKGELPAGNSPSLRHGAGDRC